MKVLVTFAVEAEFAPWRARHSFQSRDLGTLEDGTKVSIHETRIGDSKVWVFLTGVGWGSVVRDSFRKVMAEWPTYCISSGLAGGLKPAYGSGEIVVARRAGRFGTALWVEGHRPMIRAAMECGARFVDSCLTADSILASVEQKSAAGEHGDIVDMESYHILSAASGKRIPASVVIRAIGDTVAEEIPIDFGKVADSRGRLKYRPLFSEIGRRPQRIPALIGFGLRSKRAAQSLAEFLDRYVPMIQNGTQQWSKEHFQEVAAR